MIGNSEKDDRARRVGGPHLLKDSENIYLQQWHDVSMRVKQEICMAAWPIPIQLSRLTTKTLSVQAPRKKTVQTTSLSLADRS